MIAYVIVISSCCLWLLRLEWGRLASLGLEVFAYRRKRVSTDGHGLVQREAAAEVSFECRDCDRVPPCQPVWVAYGCFPCHRRVSYCSQSDPLAAFADAVAAFMPCRGLTSEMVFDLHRAQAPREDQHVWTGAFRRHRRLLLLGLTT